ncbi:MAG: Zn-dependent hydrolase [Chloroflexi bacterium]|nr:Zn-dependent hydrolase [Chloroflexota bacterium]
MLSLTASPALFAHLRVNAQRLRADFDQLAEIGATVAGGVSRLALSNEDLEARAWFANRVEDEGFVVRDDDAGNLSGVLHCPNPNAPTLLLGSHLDSVPNGGRYDGAVGVLAGLEVMRVLRDAAQPLPVHVEVIDFTDEEGCWQSLFGSRGLTGQLSAAHVSDANGDNSAFRAALTRAGIRPDDIGRARRDPHSLAGYLELHIEQGTQLERAGCTIGVVTHIVGRSTLKITFNGQAGHSGTTEPEKRRDALQGAALFILRAHTLIRDEYADGIFNCGNITVKPGQFNIIPEQAILTVECRHTAAPVLIEMEAALQYLAQKCADEYALSVGVVRTAHMPAAPMSPRCIQAIEQAAARLNLASAPVVSYAGHDAQMLASFCAAGMIFVPSLGGVSHNPREYTRWEDVTAGANVLLHAALELAFAR